MIKQRILVVGAGFAGAVLARELAESGHYLIDVIDSRSHIAGNCFDPYDDKMQLRIHQYGPHIFHTNDKGIFDYLSRFTQWLPYEHKVEALVEGIGFVPFPINIKTINLLYNKSFSKESEMKIFLSQLCEHHSKIENARHAAENLYGKELVELFFARYTKKMWDLELEELPASIVARLPVRYDDRSGYFDDKFQAMPKDGYITLFKNLLNHADIKVHLQTSFERTMEVKYTHVFNSMAIDEYYDFEFEALPYRSIKYDHQYKNDHYQPVPTINMTDLGPITRYTDWRLYPGCGSTESQAIVSYESPCSYEDNNNERYYPVKTVDDIPQTRYKKYERLSLENKKCTFIGRCGQYRYLDMHQVAANSRVIAKKFMLS
ncbi:MAG: NAD(P)-binding protein [Gammaproteobacteria bacterium]|nr:NAD(P)-binding protein [Gammaproteobacteria bacterium]